MDATSQLATRAVGPATKAAAEEEMRRWGGVAGVAGGLFPIASLVVVVSMGLPDASDVETLTDFANIETGRIIEHFVYLGSVVCFALAALAPDCLRGPRCSLASSPFASRWSCGRSIGRADRQGSMEHRACLRVRRWSESR